MVFGLIFVISPTNPSFSFFILDSMILPSIPESPTALPPFISKRFTSVLFTLPAKTIWTISIDSLSVTRSPSTKTLSLPTFFISSLISGPPPWISTILTPISHSRTISSITCCLSVSFIIAFPPYFTTTVLPVYLLMYGSAWVSTSALSAFENSIFSASVQVR